jgi:hypothetical protein
LALELGREYQKVYAMDAGIFIPQIAGWTAL